MKKIKITKKQWLYGGGVLVVLGGLSYVAYILLKDKKKPKDEVAPRTQTQTTTKTGFCKYSGFPLRMNTCASSVGQLQKKLNTEIHPPFKKLVVDNKYGDNTEGAVFRLYGKKVVSLKDFNAYMAST